MNWLVQGTDDQPSPSLPWVLIFLVLLVALAHGQTLFGTGNPGSPACDLNLIVVATAGMIYGPTFGFWIGCAGGLFHDFASSPAPIGLFALGAALVGWASGAVWRWTVRSRWGVAGLTIATFAFLHGLFIRFLLRFGGLSYPWPSLSERSEGLAVTFVLGALSYAMLAFVVQRRST